jgi:hypothetical protein
MGVALQPAGFHKLCDYRPFFGLAFQDLLREYKYWGYCDLDLFFGNLQGLATMVQDGTLDFISPWDRSSGPCTLFRNVDHVNEIGFSIRDFQSRALQPYSTWMDEGGVGETSYRLGGFRWGLSRDIKNEWRKRKCFLGPSVTAERDLNVGSGPFLAHYDEGRVMVYDRFLLRREVLYFHFMGMKSPRFWQKIGESDLRQFSFTPYGFVPGLLDPEVLRSLAFRCRFGALRLRKQTYARIRECIPQRLVEDWKVLRDRRVLELRDGRA